MAYREVTADALPQLVDGVHWVDVREPDELSGPLGKLSRAEPIPLGTLVDKVASWPRETRVLLICRSGARSARAAAALVALGFSQVLNLQGGMVAVREWMERSPEQAKGL